MNLLDLFDIAQLTLILNLSIALVLNLGSRKIQNHIIAFFVSIMLFVSIGDMFHPELMENNYFYFLRPVFSHLLYGPIIYLYLLSLVKRKLELDTIAIHTVPFFLLALVYFVIKPNLGEQTTIAQIIYGCLGDSLIVIYFILGNKQIKNQKSSEKFVIKNRYIRFYYGFNIYLLLSVVVFFIGNLALLPLEQIKIISNTITSFYFSYFQYPIWIIFCFALLYYSITEADWLKKYFVSEPQIKNKEFLAKNIDKEFVKKIENDLNRNKRYLSTGLSLTSYAKLINVEIEYIQEYLVLNNYNNFTELLNYYRVQEFKRKIIDNSYKNYTLTGIAEECGIKSKTTLYRIFKEFEGVTPKEYLDIKT